MANAVLRPRLLVLAGVLALLSACSTSGETAVSTNGTETTRDTEVPTVTVEEGDITAVITLEGVVNVAAPSELLAPTDGIFNPEIEEGRVEAGQVVGRVSAGGQVVGEVVASSAGQVTLGVHDGQAVQASQVVGEVAPPAQHEIVATIDPPVLYRFYSHPKQIAAKIDRGPGTFDCPLSHLGADPDELRSGDPLNVPVTLSCQVPADLAVFPGVRAKLAVTTAEVHSVPYLPLTAVDGEADQGRVAVVGPDGNLSIRSVQLGVTDGFAIEIKSGLKVGEEVAATSPSILDTDPSND